MGCVATRAVRVGQRPNQSRYVTSSTTTELPPNTGVTNQQITDIYSNLTANCYNFKCPPGSVPVLCLDEDSIPIIESTLLLLDSRQTGISLPIIAISLRSNGRIACMGHLKMLNRTFFNSADNANIIHNLFLWLNGHQSINEPINFINFPPTSMNEIRSCLAPHGIHVQFDDFTPELSNSKFIIVTSNFDVNNDEKRKFLNDILLKGGGIGCFYVQPSNGSPIIPINKFLIKAGLSFASCALSDDYGMSTSVTIREKIEESRKSSFYSLVDSFDKFVTTSNSNISYLDDLVTALRYHVISSGVKQIHLIDQLLNLSWRYLIDTEYRLSNGMISSYVNHSIVIAFIDELYQKIHADRIRAIPSVASGFPGLASDFTLKSYNVELPILEESLVSTGLWLPPGTISTVDCQKVPPNTHIQVGSHTISLLAKPGPWKRWPMVSFSFPFQSPTVEIASPFGGCVYLAFSDLSTQKPLPTHLKLQVTETEAGSHVQSENDDFLNITFSHITCYPRAVYQNPSIYESTKQFNTPWGELISKSIIFTLPSNKMRQIGNLQAFFDYIEDIVSMTTSYIGYELIRPYRIVFDIETIDEYLKQQELLQMQQMQQQLQFISYRNTMTSTNNNTSHTTGAYKQSSHNNTELNSCLVNNNTNGNNAPGPFSGHIGTSTSNLSFSSDVLSIVARYPIVMLIDDIDDIFFNQSKATIGLFKMIMLITIVSFPEGRFDSQTELALASFVASNIFKKMFPSFDPIDAPICEMPALFNELWLIHTQINKLLIPGILKKLQDTELPSYEVPQDRWIAFVRELCSKSKLNFVPLLENIRPIPLNTLSNIDGLQNPPPFRE